MLKANQHMRYMWIPHTDAVVVVTNNPHSPGAPLPPAPTAHSDAERTAPLRALLQVPVSCPKTYMSLQLRPKSLPRTCRKWRKSLHFTKWK